MGRQFVLVNSGFIAMERMVSRGGREVGRRGKDRRGQERGCEAGIKGKGKEGKRNRRNEGKWLV